MSEFAPNCEHVHVTALQVGKHDLPANVTVHSLGKESGVGRLTYLWRFYKLIWQLRHEYDNVFVHMNQIYVILGAPLWRAWGKRIGLWYAHGAIPFGLRVATVLSHHVFTSTKEGMRINSPKRKIVGQGIDTQLFTSVAKTDSNTTRLVTVGRISQSKNIETLLHACKALKQAGLEFSFRIIGPATTPIEIEYQKQMQELVHTLGLVNEVQWVGGMSQTALPSELQPADFFIHDGSTNSLDKALLEAALCGCIVISSNPAYAGLTQSLAPDFLYPAHNSQALANLVLAAAQPSDQAVSAQQAVTQHVQNSYSISNLISGIVAEY